MHELERPTWSLINGDPEMVNQAISRIRSRCQHEDLSSWKSLRSQRVPRSFDTIAFFSASRINRSNRQQRLLQFNDVIQYVSIFPSQPILFRDCELGRSISLRQMFLSVLLFRNKHCEFVSISLIMGSHLGLQQLPLVTFAFFYLTIL